MLRFLYSDRVDPTSSEFESEPQFAGHPRTMVDTINRTLHEEMRRNPNIVVFGEDVADCSREENLQEVKGKGGVFKATAGPADRLRLGSAFSTRPSPKPPSSAAPSGMAMRGLKPIVEIQFFDYIWPAMMQIRDELASLRWRSNNAWSAPLVIRVADRRLSQRRRDLSQPVRRIDFHAHPGIARGDCHRMRSTPVACCAPPSDATIRCCSWNTSACIASLTTARRIRGPITRSPSGKPRS